MNRIYTRRATAQRVGAFLAALLAAIGVAGCEGKPSAYETRDPDQCLRAELFKQCLAAVPAGPQQTVTNDWSEVVDECQHASYYQSLRQISQIKPECRP